MDVHSDVQQTSTVPSSLIPASSIGSDEAALTNSPPVGRHMDVQMGLCTNNPSGARLNVQAAE